MTRPIRPPVTTVTGPAAEHPSDGARRGGATERGSHLLHTYAVLVMILGTGAFFPMIPGDTQSLVFAMWACAYLVAVVGLLDDRFRKRRKIALPVTLALMGGLAVASVLWSVAPDLTLRRGIGLVGTILVGVYLARRLSPPELFDALRRAVLLVTLASLLLYASGSALALDEVHGTLRGVLPTKNTLGRIVALGVLAASAVAIMDERRRRGAAFSAMVMMAALALTASTGGMVLAAAVLGVAAAILLAAHPRGKAAVAGLATVVLAALVAFLPGTNAQQVTAAVGEDVTLTGRTEIWAFALEAFALRPTLGYGYGAFWHEDFGPPEAHRIRGYLQWDVPSGHNGLLDVALDLGVVGAVVAVVALTGLLIRGAVDLRSGRANLGALRLSVAGVTIVSNLAETGLFQLNTIYTVLLVAAVAARPPELTPQLHRRRPPSRSRRGSS
ncbi:hypothetical protein N866_04080 [Actinotalea ferrariae CF5-4]|uniref:O-antigen ligase-related domain-containing protein n=1 Tax=Actinotalea ferrariae CF5-4 TaxID=948458 RepID=A0A021VP35_9CELL|nr:O-antigen ligase family protein [Actinotalea ferrariae]EYR62949.1 hypothetical protein N866_04080 [Actinotalea ferrariae CF5-4]